MLTVIMNRPRLAVCDGVEFLAAAVASIVLTVLTLLSTVLTVHADQTEWAATAPTLGACADDATREDGGASAWG
jgi:hypothetical protein